MIEKSTICFIRTFLFSVVLVLGLFTLSGCNEGTFKNHYSTSQEIAMGEQENADIVRTEKIDEDPVLNTRIERIAAPVFAQASLMRHDVTYKITIIDSKEVNAFSIPGGWVYLYTGLIDKVGNDDDALACIIGHESAHVVRRHVVKQISDAEVKGTLVNILGIATNNYNIYNTAGALLDADELHFSREDEYEADKYGLMFAYNAGYDPNGMIRFFNKLEKLEKGDDTPVYAEDHPLTRNRIDRATALIQELREYNGHYPDDVDAATAAAANAAGASGSPSSATPATAAPSASPAVPSTSAPEQPSGRATAQ